MAKEKEKAKKRKKTQFEKDEKRSFIIATIVCIVVILAVVIALLAIYHNKKRQANSVVVMETASETEVYEESGYSESGMIVVVNQQELDDALADSNNYEILFQTEDSIAITIQSNDYTNISLTMDAPYADVQNYGTFSSITINRIASNTWTENVSGNTFYISATSSHLIIPEGVEVNRIELDQSNSSIAVENDGTIKTLTLAADSTICSVLNNKEIEQIIINRKTNLNLLGSTSFATQIDVGYDADDTVIESTVPIHLNNYASITVNMNEGAEESDLALKNNMKTVMISNNTLEDVTVIESDGTETVVLAGIENKVFEGEMVASINSEESTSASSSSSTTSTSATGSSSGSSYSSRPSSTSSSSLGSSSSNTSSSMENKNPVTQETKETKETIETKETNEEKKYSQKELDQKVEEAVSKATDDVDDKIEQAIAELKTSQLPQITSFEEIASIDAGFYGNALTTKEIYGKLPNNIKGTTGDGGTINFPVRGWIPDEKYDVNAPTGTYVFTAWLGTPETDCTIRASVTASVRVYIKSLENLMYETEEARQIDILRLYAKEGNEENKNIAEYYLATNQGENYYMVTLNTYYYNSNGEYLIEYNTSSSPYILYPGETTIFVRNITPTDDRIKACMVGVKATSPGEYLEETLGLKEKEKVFLEERDLTVGENYFAYIDPRQPEILQYGFDISIKHDQTVKKEMSEVEVSVIYYDREGYVISIETQETGALEETYLFHNGELGVGENVSISELRRSSVKNPGNMCNMIFTYPKDSAEKQYKVITHGGFYTPAE